MPSYPPGVPCWVETLQPDPRAALAFYHALFGWDGIATLPPGGIAQPAWTTYVRVDGLEAALERVRAAGGRVVVGPLDARPAGRLAIVEAPTGGILGLWEPAVRAGAQRINEPGRRARCATRRHGHSAAVRSGDVPAGCHRLPGRRGLHDQPARAVGSRSDRSSETYQPARAARSSSASSSGSKP
jgi:predicted enzyme related to lactoylglutathione lyase